ncbi:hypothetical protein GGX14DRAFT_394451 [Mycena pura]|uniref:Uncharacterized protein n=1 Tax=Mycena pura TaxID=153505 RepID=A0AAD6VIF2_9AGAR|nr:hypothetical protein GGX14DRAFT_394451 [Mycena pura]
MEDDHRGLGLAQDPPRPSGGPCSMLPTSIVLNAAGTIVNFGVQRQNAKQHVERDNQNVNLLMHTLPAAVVTKSSQRSLMQQLGLNPNIVLDPSAGEVRFGSGSEDFSPNAELEPEVRFGQIPNLEPEPRVQVRGVRFGVQRRSNAEPDAFFLWGYKKKCGGHQTAMERPAQMKRSCEGAESLLDPDSGESATAVPAQVIYLHNIENALSNLVASIFWAGGNVRPSQSATKVSIGLAGSIVLLVLIGWISIGTNSFNPYLARLRLLQIIWIFENHPELHEILEQVDDPTDDNLRSAGFVNVCLADAFPSVIGDEH